MKLHSISTRRIRLPFVTPMTTSYGTYDSRLLLLVRVVDVDGNVGWGECSALEDTSYFWENVDAAERSIEKSFVPFLSKADVSSTSIAIDLREQFPEAGPMALAAIEMAVLDAELRARHQSLADHMGVVVDTVPVSAALGIPADRSTVTLEQQVRAKVEQGVRGIKLKIQPGWDVAPVAALREQFSPNSLAVIVDANESFAGVDIGPLRALSELDVIIEQPLARDDIAGHAALVDAGIGRICLDEAVEEPKDAERAVAAGAAHMLCLKPSRLGGLLAMSDLQRRCDTLGIETRVGGMYSSALCGSVERVLAAGRPQSDIMPFGMRWAGGVDLAPAEQLDSTTGTVSVHGGPGIAPVIDETLLDQLTTRRPEKSLT